MTLDDVCGVIFVEVATRTTVPGAASSSPMAKLVPMTGIVAVESSLSVPAGVAVRPGRPSLKMTAADAPAPARWRPSARTGTFRAA